jgi:uncharacterized protein
VMPYHLALHFNSFMSIYRKVRSVEKIFSDLQQETDAFRAKSQLSCKLSCGKCCFKADIEATILEFLPYAYHLYKNGLALEWHHKLQEENSSICVILNPFSTGIGQCASYPYRGLICRLFGFSARRNKYGKAELVTCDIIKTEQADAYQNTRILIEEEAIQIPIMHQYYSRMASIDSDLTREFYPINTAIKKAIEEVLHYYAYRPARFPKSA